MVGFLITLCLKDWLFETKGLEYTGYSMFGGRMCPTLAESSCTSIRTLLFKDINDSLMAVCCAHAWPQITFFATDFLWICKNVPNLCGISWLRGRCLCSLVNPCVYAECRSLLLSICQGGCEGHFEHRGPLCSLNLARATFAPRSSIR